jgi:hypothetical protein
VSLFTIDGRGNDVEIDQLVFSVTHNVNVRAQAWSSKALAAGGSLRREFHSTPDLAAEQRPQPPRTRSSEDVHGTTLHTIVNYNDCSLISLSSKI